MSATFTPAPLFADMHAASRVSVAPALPVAHFATYMINNDEIILVESAVINYFEAIDLAHACIRGGASYAAVMREGAVIFEVKPRA